MDSFKLICRLKDKDELRTEAENRQKFELQKQQRELQTNLNIKRAMRKWVTMDKETRRQQTKTIQQTGNGGPKAIPEWAR
jgi:transposase